MQELVAIKNRELKKEAFKDNATALKILNSHPDLFSADDLITLGKNFRGAAIYITSNEALRAKVDDLAWLGVMSQYSWDALLQYHAQTTPTKK